MFSIKRDLNLLVYSRIFSETFLGNLWITLSFILAIFINTLVYKLTKPTFEHDSDKGTAEWANENIEHVKKDAKKLKEQENLVRVRINDPAPKQRGIILHQDKDYFYVDIGVTHSLFLGITGAGKDQTSVFPNIDLLSRSGPKGDEYRYTQQSMIIPDSKGEQCSNWAEKLKNRGYNVKIINFEEPYYSDGYDPLHLIKEAYLRAISDEDTDIHDLSEVVNLIKGFATTMTADESSKDKFWQNTAKDLVSGYTLGLLEDLVPHDSHLATSYMLATGISEFSTSYLNVPGGESIKRLDWFFVERGVGNRAKSLASSYLGAPDKTKESIVSTASEALSIFADEGVARLTSSNSIDYKDIIEKPTAIFLIIPDDDPTRFKLASLFLEQVNYALSKIIKRDYKGTSPRVINFIVNEFGQLPVIPHLDTKLSMSRSRGLRWLLYLQGFSQFKKYGDKADTIKVNCTNMIYLLTTCEKTAKQIQDRLCNKTIMSDSISQRSNEVQSSTTTNSLGRPLMFVNELLEMPEEQGVVLRARKKPILAKFKYAFRYMDLEKKGIKELKERGDHANLDLRIYNDYLTATNALDKYRNRNYDVVTSSEAQMSQQQEFDFGTGEILQLNEKELLEKTLYSELIQSGKDPFEISQLFESIEFRKLVSDHLYAGSSSITKLKKEALKILKKSEKNSPFSVFKSLD